MLPVLMKGQAGTPTKQAIARFLRYIQRFSDNTQRHYRDSLWRFFPYLPFYIEQTTPEHIEIFLQSLKMLNSSKNATLVPIRSFFRFLENYYGLANPASKVKPLREDPPKQRVISEAEYESILKVCTEQERCVIEVLGNTGIRATEFCELSERNVSPDETYITIIGKGKKRRIIPLNKTARQAIINLPKNYTRNTLSNLCRSLSKRAAIPQFGPHALRHRFCTILIQKGVPITKVSKIMGHASIAITERIYLHLLPVDFLGCTDCLDV